MSGDALPLVFTRGERAVFHAVDPMVPAADLVETIALYFGFRDGCAIGELRWLGENGPVPLDPDRPVGEQVPPEAEIELGPA